MSIFIWSKHKKWKMGDYTPTRRILWIMNTTYIQHTKMNLLENSYEPEETKKSQIRTRNKRKKNNVYRFDQIKQKLHITDLPFLSKSKLQI